MNKQFELKMSCRLGFTTGSPPLHMEYHVHSAFSIQRMLNWTNSRVRKTAVAFECVTKTSSNRK